MTTLAPRSFLVVDALRFFGPRCRQTNRSGVGHAAWLEYNRRTDNGTLAKIVVSNAMGSPVSRQWKGYWQRAA